MGESNVRKRIRIQLADLRFPFSITWFAGSLALAVRLALFPYVSGDAAHFLLPWMQEFRDGGATALGGEFSNYNFPYLFLMFLGSLLPVAPLLAIKIVSLAGDCLLAFSLAAVVAKFGPANITPRAAAMIALFLPTIILNASMWGQCDSFYTAFLLLSLRSLLRNDGRGAWLWWAVALSFKLQSVFFLPALALITLRKGFSATFPLMGAMVWLLLSFPPVLFGRSFPSTFSVYADQTQDSRLVAGAANLYAWFPNVSAVEGRVPALLACGAALLVTTVAYWRGPDTAERRVLLAVTATAICPLLLPQMHDRYFFTAEVMSLILVRHRKLFFVPWLFALSGLYAYVLFFAGNENVLLLRPASIATFFATSALLCSLFRRADKSAPGSATFTR